MSGKQMFRNVQQRLVQALANQFFEKLLSVSKSKHLWFTSAKPGQRLKLELNKRAFVPTDLNISYKSS